MMQTKNSLLLLLLGLQLSLAAQRVPAPPEKITYKLISTANSTWGYDIYTNGKLFVHQPQIPGLPGGEGFKTKAIAGSVAQLVMSKIKKGEMPPTVTIEELKKLKAI
jgi:hypothetical protein